MSTPNLFTGPEPSITRADLVDAAALALVVASITPQIADRTLHHLQRISGATPTQEQPGAAHPTREHLAFVVLVDMLGIKADVDARYLVDLDVETGLAEGLKSIDRVFGADQ